MTLVDRIQEAVDYAGKHTAEVLTDAFRTFAVEQGWPQDVANLCSINSDANIFHVHVDGELAERVLDYELGTQDRAPIPAIHRFMERIDAYQEVYSESAMSALRDSGVL